MCADSTTVAITNVFHLINTKSVFVVVCIFKYHSSRYIYIYIYFNKSKTVNQNQLTYILLCNQQFLIDYESKYSGNI